MMSAAIEPRDRLLRLPDVQREFAPLSKKQIYRLERTDRFPRRIRIGANAVAWRESDLRRWLQERAAATPPLGAPATG